MEVETLLRQAFSDRVLDQPDSLEGDEERDERLRSVRNRIDDLLDTWSEVSSGIEGAGQQLRYQKYERGRATQTLLRDMMDDDINVESHRKFRASRSLRDVEPEVRLTLIEQ